MLTEFEGCTAVITGAASGIGLALTNAALERGMKVVAADHNADALRDLEQSHQAMKNLAVCVTDVSSHSDIGKLADFAGETFGDIHLLCNNAGVASAGRIWDHGPDFWKWILGVNVLSVVYGAHQFVPRMIASRQAGAIVNTASMGCLFSSANMGAYGATKHAVLAISDSLRQDLTAINAPISVSLLCPGPVRTPIFDNDLSPDGVEANTDEQTWQSYKTLIGAGMDPAEVASRTFSAIAKGEFWIVPDAGMIDLASERHRQVLEAADRF